MEKEKFIGKKTGGIPESVFAKPSEGIFCAQSGRIMRKSIENSKIELSDAKQPDMRFNITILPQMKFFGVDVPTGTLAFVARNKGFDGQHEKKHPDIYPAKLLKKSTAYFEKHATVNALMGIWTNEAGLSDNYCLYREKLQTFGEKEYTIEEKRKAAKKTWTGKIATKLGFTYISELSEHESNVVVVFSREF